MNLNRLVASFVVFLVSSACPEVISAYTFQQNSNFSSGKWIKIEIDSTGLYQIPYDQLKEMGFENPQAVGVYGKGGVIQPLNFAETGKGLAYQDDIKQIAIIHDNQSLYFYGKGTEDITFETKVSPTSGKDIHLFKRGMLNIYSNSGYYFLSDKEIPRLATEAAYEEDATMLSSGYGYIYHEKDISHNITNTGQLFWGESFLSGKPALSWTSRTPYLSDGTGRLSYRLYTSPLSRGTVEISIKDSESTYKQSFSTLSADKFWDYPPSASNIPIEYALKQADNITLSINAISNNADYLNLDYWLLTYPKALPGNSALKENPAEQYSFPTLPATSYSLELSESLKLLDVTFPDAISLGKRSCEDPSKIGFLSSARNSSVIIYDPQRKQLQIKSWQPVANINLHALHADGADLLIITTPRFRTYADRIADLHRSHEHIKVAVATPEEIYNEFSSGVPDPMAYRAIAKMLYQSSGNRLRNILLFGPSDRNIRQSIDGENRFDRIIAMQQANATPGRAASPAYDFYGIMKDVVNSEQLHRETMEIGVGLLSCESEMECQRAIRKIEEYLTDDTQAWRINETLTVGGLHDNHTHGQQAEDFGNYIRNYSGIGGISHSTIAIDAYGNEEARRRFISHLESGKNISIWFGHGARTMLGQDKNFFTTSEAINLKNRHLGFMYMGGCDFSIPDARSRGLGETIVLDSERGMAGAIVSTRTAWSNQNYDLGKRIIAGWLSPSGNDTSPTIGEIYAYSKSVSPSANSMTFILTGDPALRVPSPIRKINMSTSRTASCGEKIKAEGTIVDKSGKTDNSFNGKIVLKLMEPSMKLRSKDYVTGTSSKPVKININGKDTIVYYTLDVTYDTNLLSATETEVTNGKFSTDLVIPGKADKFKGKQLRLHGGAFDKSSWLGAAGSVGITVSDTPANEEIIDRESPTVELVYDNAGQAILVNAYDETALPLSPASYEVSVDGKPALLTTSGFMEDGNTGNHFEGYTDVSDLTDGVHSYAIRVRDIAGNVAFTEMDFTKCPSNATLSLNLSTKAAVDEIEIFTDSDFSGILEFEIRNSKGETIISNSTEMKSITWDCKDSEGKKVETGLYRARIRTSNTPVKYSEWVNFAVLD